MLLGSHFDGISAFPYAASFYGIKAIWATEIEPFPVAVSKHHFPHVRHYGDISRVNGAELEPVDIITFGSPCQDMSVAGKREGLYGERSGLFMEAVRTIREMREATNGAYPRYAIWENVPGAFSSNKGHDFRAVLEEITEAEIPMPQSGKWATAGMVRGNGRSVAWRVLDAQYWGVPQRRRRIFLVADFRGQCAPEILFEPEGMCWNTSESRKARQEAAAGAGDGVAIPINTQIATRHNKLGRGTGFGVGDNGDPGMKQQTYIIQSATMGEGKKQNGLGITQDGPCYTLDCRADHAVCYDPKDLGRRSATFEDKSPTIKARCGTGGNNVPVTQVGYAVRRLTPTECERLQGFPDGWTDIPGASDTARYKAIGNSIAVPCLDFIYSQLVKVAKA